jgi:transposase
MREIANAIFCVLRAGCAWRLLPDSFPPWRTAYRWFVRLAMAACSRRSAITS